jgi:hypothetical protein
MEIFMKHFLLAVTCMVCIALLVVSCSQDQTDPMQGNVVGNSNDGLSKTSAKTAQSAMIDIQGVGDFIIQGNEVWHFDQDCGATYFEATGGNTSQQENAKRNIAQQQRCKFWNGSGDLEGGTEGQVTVTVVSQPTEPKSCWFLQHSSGGNGTVDICPTITIAGESFLLSDKFSPNGKYSFTLRNADGSSRILNLTVTLSGDASQTDYPGHTLVDGNALGNNCLLDFLYLGDAGKNGTAQQYLHTSDALGGATMGSILNSDSFNKNDAGCPYTTIGVVDPICYTLGAGSYTITVTGTIKGVDGNANLSFTGTGSVHISAEGCQHFSTNISAEGYQHFSTK